MFNRKFRCICCRTVVVNVLFLLLLPPAAPLHAQEVIRIGGTGGALEAMKGLAAEFSRIHAGIAVRIVPSMGSTGGIKAVLAGDIDIGLSSRRLQKSEDGAIARSYGRTPLGLATMKKHTPPGFTVQELADIYAGRNGKWPDGSSLRVVLRPAAEFDSMLLKGMSEEMDRAVTGALQRKGMILAVTDQDSADAIERVPGALGTVTLAQIVSEKRPFRILALNGVKPDLHTLVSGSYPYFKTYYVITKQTSSPAVRGFVDFIFSRQGREILTRYGYQAVAP